MTHRSILPKTGEIELRIKSFQSPSRLFTVGSSKATNSVKKRLSSGSCSSNEEDDERPPYFEFVKFQKKGGMPISKLHIDNYSDKSIPFARLRLDHWYTNDEIFKILTHCTCLLSSITNNGIYTWLSNEVVQHPLNGSVFLFDRRRVKNFKKDAFIWKRRKTGGANSIREDRMSLKANGSDCIYACYTHSALMSTFHRRCYWLRDNPDIVLVHYLQTPNSETGECAFNFNSNPIMSNGDDQQPANENDLKKEIKSMLWPFYLDKNINSGNAVKFIDLIASKLLPIKNSNESSDKQQHVRVNLMTYANLNTEQILSRFKIDESFEKNDNMINKSNMIEIDDNTKTNSYNCAKSDKNYVSLDENNNLVQNNSDKNTRVLSQKVAIKRSFKSSKSLDGDNKQNFSEKVLDNHVQLSITCSSSSVSLSYFYVL